MKLTTEFQPIRNWAVHRNIYVKGDIKTQTLKLLEEAGELAKAINHNDKPEIIDGIGDCVIVLTSIAQFAGVSIEECINAAYEVISKRTGHMKNGTFIKDK